MIPFYFFNDSEDEEIIEPFLVQIGSELYFMNPVNDLLTKPLKISGLEESLREELN